MTNDNHGIDTDVSIFPILQGMLNNAETTSPQPMRVALGSKNVSENLCIALHEDQIAVADKKSSRFIASAGTGPCYAIFLRNPKTSASMVAHLNVHTTDPVFAESIKRVAKGSNELDMYIMGGDESPPRDNATLEYLEKTLATINEIKDELGLNLRVKVVNLEKNKTEHNAVLDTSNGDYFYVDHDVIKPHILFSMESNDDLQMPTEKLIQVFDGLKDGANITSPPTIPRKR